MSFRNTAILAVLVALFGAYLYWVERPALEEESKSTRILEVDPDAITHLTLQTPEAKIEAMRDGETWRITAPIQTTADARVIETLLGTAAEAEVKRRLEDSTDPARFGLDQPDATLQLWIGEKALPSLSVGDGTPIGFNAYARRGDQETVLLTGGTVRTALQKTLSDLRDKTILDIDREGVTAIAIAPRGGESVRLERTDPGWRLVSPIDTAAADAPVRTLLGALQALRAVEFVDEDGEDTPDAHGLAPAALEVTIESEDGPPVVLLIGVEVDVGDKKLVAASRGGEAPIYLVASHVPASLGKTAADLRDKTVLPTGAREPAEVRVRHSDGESFVLVKREGSWGLQDETQWETDPLVAKRFVDDLVGLAGDEIVNESGDLAEVGLDAPGFTIETVDEAGTVSATLVVRREDGTPPAHYAAVTGAAPVYAIPDYAFTRIDKRVGDLISSDEGPSIID